MAITRCFVFSLHLLLLGSSFLWPTIQASYTPFLEQSFFFNYNPPAQPVPIPVTAQCETIHITWERGVATGPNPTAPYYLQVYTSTFVFPFVVAAGTGLSFDWSVPFAPGTQYQICMFDKNGNTGGCQATYTVISASRVESPTCQNVTFPLGPLDVEATVSNGPLSQFGWVDQCTDISVLPKNGTPPYTFTVAPALHPPYNITTNEMKRMNWTVGLSWASPFFVSVADSSGNFWANGPIHSGGNGPMTCLAGKDVSSTSGLAPSTAVGAGVGGLVVGGLAGILAAYIFMHRRRRKERRGHFMDLSSGSPVGSPTTGAFDHPPTSATSAHYQSASLLASQGHVLDSSLSSNNPSSNSIMLTRLTRGSSQYQVEPFAMPTEDGHLTAPHPASTRLSDLPSSRDSQAGGSGQNQIYVIHHDGGRAPVSVYHSDGTQVVELPPRYAGSEIGIDARSAGQSEGVNSGSDGRSDTGRSQATQEPPILLQPRKPGQVRKSRMGSYVDPYT
ncbi:hypothetical protein Hypma_015152 [Hypsizygus marmoreus]|uniref:Fibronectin type-III domain-containing protein n=1 Tax=Hypsizygus marmoreus TaxID=39966 RepID=A0A369K4Y8_HYPMA|nr:hypothetical protein Hypma_015152 [Hypsizygus marmoreus]